VKATICGAGPTGRPPERAGALSQQVRAELVKRLADVGVPGSTRRASCIRSACRGWREQRRVNIPTKDLVYLLHGEGVETGIDLQGLIAVAAWLEETQGRELPGQVSRAGTFAPVAG
jgi:hypothetical protein